MSTRSAPLGIKVLCGVSGLFALLSVLGGLALLASGSGLGFGLGLLVLVLSGLQFVLLWGLWTVRSWAWTWSMVLYGLNLVLGVLNLLIGSPEYVLGVLITAAIMWYLYSKRSLYRDSRSKATASRP